MLWTAYPFISTNSWMICKCCVWQHIIRFDFPTIHFELIRKDEVVSYLDDEDRQESRLGTLIMTATDVLCRVLSGSSQAVIQWWQQNCDFLASDAAGALPSKQFQEKFDAGYANSLVDFGSVALTDIPHQCQEYFNFWTIFLLNKSFCVTEYWTHVFNLDKI